MSTLKFSLNTPVRLALAYPTGKQVEGQYGPQVMYTLSEAPAGETAMYLIPAVAEQIDALKLQKGESLEILKLQKPGSKIEWKVSRVEPAKKPMQTVNGHAALNGVPYWDLKSELIGAYDMAVQVLVEARAHAAMANLPIQFTGEDVRQLAAVIVIDRGKDRRTPGLRAA